MSSDIEDYYAIILQVNENFMLHYAAKKILVVLAVIFCC